MKSFRMNILAAYFSHLDNQQRRLTETILHLPKYIESQQRCKHSKEKNDFSTKTCPKTNYKCSSCQVPLCILCFEKFHI